jgi:cytosine/adenosine deaminase-related metal-dependent hydrolase
MEAVPELLPEMWSRTPLRVFSFRELIHLKEGPSMEQFVHDAVGPWADLPQPTSEQPLGLSPHAPYSTTGQLLQRSAREARAQGWLLSTHVAESEEEYEMFRHRQGPLFDWLQSQRSMHDCGHRSPIAHLAELDYLGNDLLAVHVNYLEDGDASLLARHQVPVVHCPRSHNYFRHRAFPWPELAQAGITLGLGTDSLATVVQGPNQPSQLNMFDEMRTLAEKAPDIPPSDILRMATINGARALGKAGELGELAPGALADLVAVPYAGPTSAGPEALIYFNGAVAASMVGGTWVWGRPEA